MISPLGLLSKWHLSPALPQVVANRTLMVLSKAFLLRFVGPHDPAVQGFIELACLHQSLTDPVVETRTRDFQETDEFCWPPFVGQELVARPETWAWCSHRQVLLHLSDRLHPKAAGGVGRGIAGIGERLGNSGGGPACLGQLLDQLADLRIRTQLAQLANRSNHDALGVASAEPLDAHLDPLAAALHIHHDPFDEPFA